MRGMDRKGVELAFNAIVVAALALLVLTVMVLFITGMFAEIFQRWPSLEIDPTPSDPIVFAPLEIRTGRETKMSIAFYNGESQDVPGTVLPSIRCTQLPEVYVDAAGMDIPVGDIGKYAAKISVPDNTEPGDYACTMQISETEETFFMRVE